MKLIRPSFEIWEQPSGVDGIYKQIEKVGRVCYRSEDKITEDSAKGFVDRMIKSGHGAMLEHGTVYLRIPHEYDDSTLTFYEDSEGDYWSNKYSKAVKVWKDEDTAYTYVTTNLRVLVENGWMDDLKYICEPTKYHAKRITVRFVCDRGVSHEFVRHKIILCVA